MGLLNSPVDFTVWINVSQTTQNKWQEDTLVLMVVLLENHGTT